VLVEELLDRAADVVFSYRLGQDPGFAYVNRAVFAVAGYTPQELYADPLLLVKLVHPMDYPLVRGALQSGVSSASLVVRWVRKDGRPIWVEQRTTSVRNEDGELVAVEGIARAITDPGARAVRMLGDLRADILQGRVLVGGRYVTLTLSELRLLVLLTDPPGRIVSREAIMHALQGSDHVERSRSCETHVSKLRSKIGRDRIETVRGRGYRFRTTTAHPI
jgi:PAS domain S-box-containing protein